MSAAPWYVQQLGWGFITAAFYFGSLYSYVALGANIYTAIAVTLMLASAIQWYRVTMP